VTQQGSTYFCPVCAKPFDRDDKLSDFAIAAHEKDHAPERSNPTNMIRYDGDSLMWVCKICGHPLHIGAYSARQAAIGHCRQAHGSTTASSTSVTAGGGRGGRSGHRSDGIVDGVLDAVGDGLSAVGDAVGGALGKALDFLGGMLGD
jgi:hypothetical protein